MKSPATAFLALACLGVGVSVGRWVIPVQPQLPEESAETEPPAVVSMLAVEEEARVPKPVVEEIPEVRSARELMNLAGGASQARNSAKMYLALEGMPKEALARLARETAVLARSDWKAWSVQASILARWTEIAPQEALAHAKGLKSTDGQRNALGAVFTQLAATNPSLAERELATLSPARLRRDALTAFANGVAESDPVRALGILERHGASNASWAYSEVAQKWARQAPEEAGRYAAGLPPGRKREQMIYRVSEAWGGSDPEGAMNWARSLDDRRMRQSAMGSILRTMAGDDPEEALAQVEGEDRQYHKSLRQTVLSMWFQNDQEAAMEWIDSRPNKAERLRLFYGSAYSLIWEDPEGAYAMVKDLPDGQQKLNFMGNILQNWSWHEPERSLEWLESFPTETQGRLIGENSLWGLAEADPEGLREILEQIPLTDKTKNAFNQLARQYVEEDPEKALRWTEQIESSSVRTEMLTSVYGNWAIHDPEAAGKRAMGVSDVDQRKQLLTSVARSWAGMDPEKALEWADGMSGEDRANALGAVIQQTASEDPVKAAGEVERLVSEGMSETRVAETAAAVAGTWSSSEPRQASEWALALDGEKARKQAVAQVVATWSGYDPVAASEWISTLEAGPERDAAAGKLVASINETDPERAYAWATAIADERERYEAIEQTVIQWKKSNEAAAREAIGNAALSEADQQKLLEKFDS